MSPKGKKITMSLFLQILIQICIASNVVRAADESSLTGNNNWFELKEFAFLNFQKNEFRYVFF